MTIFGLKSMLKFPLRNIVLRNGVTKVYAYSTKGKVINIFRKVIQSPKVDSQEQVIHINSQKINYLKVGNGPSNVLCFPGLMGTIWNDFKPQIEGLDRNKFTIIAWDPPGHGNSRPPERFLNSVQFYYEDADTAYDLMKFLGIKSFSLLGWSDGGISSMILAAKYPGVVDNLVTWGANSFVLPEDIQAFEGIKDLEKWSKRMKEPLICIYGEKLLQELITHWYNTMKDICIKGGDICSPLLRNIECPTLILHGDKDPVVSLEHPKFLSENIRGATVHHFPEGKHNIHLRYAKEFNDIVTRFLVQ